MNSQVFTVKLADPDPSGKSGDLCIISCIVHNEPIVAL